MDKAMREMWRMKRKAEQKQLNRLALGVLRTRWAESPWRVFVLFIMNSVVSWLVIWGVLFAGLGWMLLCHWLPSFGEFYDGFAAIGREDFVRQSQQFATILGNFSSFPTVLLAVFLGAASMWSSCMKSARREQREPAYRNGSAFGTEAERERMARALLENTQFIVTYAPGVTRPMRHEGDKE